jgi:DNA-binding transcriptional MerR regulator
MMSSPEIDPYADPVDPHRARLSIDELAAVTGVSRRTVHYYIQRRLIDPPLGRGRGRHYDRRHALQILNVRDLQRMGVALSDMTEAPLPARREGGELAGAQASASTAAVAPAGQAAAAAAGEGRRSPGKGASVSSVVRIRLNENVTVELTAGPEVITGEFVDHLAIAVDQVIARHRGAPWRSGGAP